MISTDPKTTDQTPPPQKFLSLKLLDNLTQHPTSIKSLHTHNNKLYVSREHYSDIYYISENNDKINLQHLAEMEPCQELFTIGGVMCIVGEYQLRVWRRGAWEQHSFSTGFRALRIIGDYDDGVMMSFHQKESILWQISQEAVEYTYHTKTVAPYHLTPRGTIEGHGRKINTLSKTQQFTVCQEIDQKYLFLGDNQGVLHIYDWKYGVHIKSFSGHEGAIMVLKINQRDVDGTCVYYTGCDSKISCVKEVNGQWQQFNSTRGQSHDILGLTIFNNYLISGGLTTDLCFYPINHQTNLLQQISPTHKISYTSSPKISTQSNYALVNKYTKFQLWQLNKIKERVKLLVDYTLSQGKWMRCMRLVKNQEGVVVVGVMEEETVLWKFQKEVGLTKYMTVRSSYLFVEVLSVNHFLAYNMTTNQIEKVSYKTGKIGELFEIEMELPTTFSYLGNNHLLIASNLSNKIQVHNIKTRKLQIDYDCSRPFSYVGKSDKSLLMKFVGDRWLYRLGFDGNIKEEKIIELPVDSIRFGGFLGSISSESDNQTKFYKNKNYKYWFGVSQGKIVMISNIESKDKKKKIRVRQTKRIGEVFMPTGKLMGCNLCVVPLDFGKMIDEMEVKPIFTKKIV